MTELVRAGEIVSFDEDKRELSMRVVPWDTDALTNRGYERFERTAFDGLDPGRFVLRQRHQDPPTGRGIELDAETDPQWLLMRFRVARTQAGDEQLTLVKDGVETGVSVGFEDGKFEISKAEDGKRRITHQAVNPEGMLEVSTTYIPAFREAAVLQVREKETMAEPITEAAEVPPAPTVKMDGSVLAELEARLFGRIDKLEERQAAMLLNAPPVSGSAKGELRKVVKLQIRELADVTTAGNEGVLPDAIVSEMLGRVEAGRPFLNATRRLPTPSSGTRLIVPRLVQGPLVDTQESEKHELASRATVIDTVDFPMITIGGAADISMQLLQRSSPEFLSLWLALLGDALAIDADDKALDALLAEAGVVEGGDFDPESPAFGGAFTNAVTATGRTMFPDRIFLGTAAMAAMIDAKEPSGGGGAPLYPGLATISGLTSGGTIPGAFTLTPVWVPALDDEAVDVIVGPSQAFGWAEDGSYTLQADVPSKFGRDIGVASMIWFAPLYPAAFTSYTLAS